MRALVSRLRGPSGQGSVEFVIVAPLLLLTIFMIMWAGYSFYERATLNNQLSSLGSELPSNWQSMNTKDLVRKLMLDNATLDPDALTVVGEPKLETAKLESAKDKDEVAQALDMTKSTVTTQTLTVTATVEYRFTDLWSWWGATTARNTVTRTYLIGQKHEYS